MQLCTIFNRECIMVHPHDEPNCAHWVDLTVDGDLPKFSVTYCCDDEWYWEFKYTKANYEIVKHIVMDCLLGYDTMDEAIEAMDEMFEIDCAPIVYEDEDDCSYECDGDCANCEYDFK